VHEIGSVIEVSDDQVKILIKRHASCESCGACGLGGKPEITITVRNDLGAVRGDQVRLELQTGKMYQAAFLVYAIPLIMMLVGYYAGQSLARTFQWGNGESSGIISGLIAVVLTYCVIHYWERKKQLGAEFQPKLVEIIRAPEEDSPALK